MSPRAHIFRRLRRAFVWGVPISISAAIAVAWVRSYRVAGELDRVVVASSHVRVFLVDWGCGTADFVYNYIDPLPDNQAPQKSRFEFQLYPVTSTNEERADLSSLPQWLSWIQYLGFSYYKADFPVFKSHVFGVPFWFLAMLPLAVPALVLRRRLRRRRYKMAGRCGGCGYDLRASEGVCPECGMPRPSPIAPSQ